MSIRKAVIRALAAALPWPHGKARKAAVAAAEAEARESRRRAAHARSVAADLQRMARDNHFAAAIARQIMEGRK